MLVDLADAGDGILGLTNGSADAGTLVCLAYDVLAAAQSVSVELDDRERIAAAMAVVGMLPGGAGLPYPLSRHTIAEWKAEAN